MAAPRRFLIALAAVLTVSFVHVPGAFARNKTELKSVLGNLKWGDTKKEVLDKLKKRLMHDVRKDKRVAHDPVLLARARKRALAQWNKAKKSYTRLEGKKTGYEVSVIADEFSPNNGEAFIRIKDRVAQRFFFFVDGKLYKLVVSYNPSYLRNVGFEAFVGQSARKYGRPTSAEYDTIRGEDQLALVTWKDPETTLTVKNKKELFDTYTMSFADRQTIKRLIAEKRNVGGSEKDEEELSSAVKSLMNDAGNDPNSDVVDGIAGHTDINLNEGRPKDDQVRRYNKDGSVSTKGKKKKHKKHKKKHHHHKKHHRKKKKAPDFSKLKANTNDDLIIY